MSYSLKDIRNLRIDWAGESISYQAASLHFESGNERFHVWLAPNTTGGLDDIDDRQFNMSCILYANPINNGSYRDTKKLDLSKPTHKKLREYLSNAVADAGVGGYTGAVQTAAKRYIEARDRAIVQHRQEYAQNIRDTLKNAKFGGPEFDRLIEADDDDLIALRSILVRTTYPDDKPIRQVSGVVEL